MCQRKPVGCFECVIVTFSFTLHAYFNLQREVQRDFVEIIWINLLMTYPSQSHLSSRNGMQCMYHEVTGIDMCAFCTTGIGHASKKEKKKKKAN